MNDREWPDLRWCAEPALLVGEVMEDWLAVLAARRPWDEMFPDDLSGEFRAVLAELLRAGGELTPMMRATCLRGVAREHGAFRRRQGYHALILAEEVAIAEDAIVAAVERAGAPGDVLDALQDSLGPVMRRIERAMYSGYVDCTNGPDSTFQ